MASHREPVVVSATVTFDQLDEVSVRTLLLALDPRPLLGLVPRTSPATPRYAVHLGAGKPFGLGSAVPRIRSLAIAPVATRYAGAAAPAHADRPDWHASPKEYCPAIQQRTGRFTTSLSALAKILDLRGLGDWERFVSYPPAKWWAQVQDDSFRASYQFFVQASGKNFKTSQGRYEPLPRIGDADPSLPIITKGSGGGDQ